MATHAHIDYAVGFENLPRLVPLIGPNLQMQRVAQLFFLGVRDGNLAALGRGMLRSRPMTVLAAIADPIRRLVQTEITCLVGVELLRLPTGHMATQALRI